jgi:chloramphenicol-sensitive protein RarD
VYNVKESHIKSNKFPGCDFVSENKSGVMALFLAYFCWGSMPVYWKALQSIPSSEILGHRVIWSAVFTLFLIVMQKNWGTVVRFITTERKKALCLAGGGFLITFNWGLYIWAINHGRILESSLGYFINPLVSVFFGMLFFHEKLRRFQLAALMLALSGVAVELIAARSIPLVSIGLAMSFGLYGVLKKAVPVAPSIGLFIETITVTPFALAWLVWVQENGAASFPYDYWSDMLLAGTGVMTSIPLLLFASGAKKVPLTTLGFVQYISPTLTFLIGTLIYSEPLNVSRICTFVFIWAALVLYTADAFMHTRKESQNILEN